MLIDITPEEVVYIIENYDDQLWGNNLRMTVRRKQVLDRIHELERLCPKAKEMMAFTPSEGEKAEKIIKERKKTDHA